MRSVSKAPCKLQSDEKIACTGQRLRDDNDKNAKTTALNQLHLWGQLVDVYQGANVNNVGLLQLFCRFDSLLHDFMETVTAHYPDASPPYIHL